MQLIARHGPWFEVDVKKGAKFPGAIPKNSVFRFEAVIEWGVRESGLEGDLNFVQAGGADESENIIEYFGSIGIEAENETAVHGDAIGLNSCDGVLIVILLARFPVRIQLDPIQTAAARALEADEDLLTAGVAHEAEKFVILGNIDIALGKPADILASQFAKERFVVRPMDEAIVVGELDERLWPNAFDGVDLGDDFLDGL